MQAFRRTVARRTLAHVCGADGSKRKKQPTRSGSRSLLSEPKWVRGLSVWLERSRHEAALALSYQSPRSGCAACLCGSSVLPQACLFRLAHALPLPLAALQASKADIKRVFRSRAEVAALLNGTQADGFPDDASSPVS